MLSKKPTTAFMSYLAVPAPDELHVVYWLRWDTLSRCARWWVLVVVLILYLEYQAAGGKYWDKKQ